MKQIYYTQCPIGYGMGASNGFQIKRLTPGYPLSGDYRHFSLRAFLPGSRTLGPPALRYRRAEDGDAEIAWLSPRTHEYETERGPWGRPGGQFAHALRPSEGELDAIARWPAGLFGQPFWKRTDPGPALGQPPDDLELTAASLRWPPSFDAMAALALELHAAPLLGPLLAAVALAAREDRTLFLIDRAERLGERIALLTFAFPPRWRERLTFSTYHDRPEELPGFRLQGTVSEARPNRGVLLGSGLVADLWAGTIEPHVAPSRWSTALAGWFTGPSERGRSAWESFCRTAARAKAPEDPRSLWADEWLDGLVRLGDGQSEPPDGRDATGQWTEQAALASWAGRSGLGHDWTVLHGPSWWRAVSPAGEAARTALLAQLALLESWDGPERAEQWGAVVAEWSAAQSESEREVLVGRAFELAPPDLRPAFARALIRGLPTELTTEILGILKSHPACGRSTLLPLEVVEALGPALDRRQGHPLKGLLVNACGSAAALAGVLETIEAESRDRPSARELSARALAEVLPGASFEAVGVVLNWALGRGDQAEAWLGPYLRRVFADPHDQEEWKVIDLRVAAEHHAEFARVVLTIAGDERLPDEAFRWGVEEVLLALPATARPHDPAWPGLYLDRLPSGLDLLKRLFTKEYRRMGVKRWLDRARALGQLAPAHTLRIDDCEVYARALMSGDAQALAELRLPAVFPEERGTMLGQLLAHLGDASPQVLDLALDTCREAWPGAFHAGAPGLRGLAETLAEALAGSAADATRWFERVMQAAQRVGLSPTAGGPFESDGLVAELVAATTRRIGEGPAAWQLRRFMLHRDEAWRALAADVRRELEGASASAAVGAFERWDRHLAKGLLTARFFEVWLNCCDGAQLAALVATRTADLRSLGPIRAWGTFRTGGEPGDIREQFARRAPMAPLPAEALPALRAWMRPAPETSARGQIEPDDGDLVPLDSEEEARVASAPNDAAGEHVLSELGRARWGCIDALSVLHRPGLDPGACWQTIEGWPGSLRLGALEPSDRYKFLAWVILRLDTFEGFQVARLARWLTEGGIVEAGRISGWAAELNGLTEIRDATHIARMALAGELAAQVGRRTPAPLRGGGKT